MAKHYHQPHLNATTTTTSSENLGRFNKIRTGMMERGFTSLHHKNKTKGEQQHKRETHICVIERFWQFLVQKSKNWDIEKVCENTSENFWYIIRVVRKNVKN
mmetsp:Transcript_2076/g.2945  ORF Transcript_2076/g.2945 Transcript_2076/m.2945 type:complete len:102 (-) Transcript_2076:31-336(-)